MVSAANKSRFAKNYISELAPVIGLLAVLPVVLESTVLTAGVTQPLIPNASIPSNSKRFIMLALVLSIAIQTGYSR